MWNFRSNFIDTSFSLNSHFNREYLHKISQVSCLKLQSRNGNSHWLNKFSRKINEKDHLDSIRWRLYLVKTNDKFIANGFMWRNVCVCCNNNMYSGCLKSMKMRKYENLTPEPYTNENYKQKIRQIYSNIVGNIAFGFRSYPRARSRARSLAHTLTYGRHHHQCIRFIHCLCNSTSRFLCISSIHLYSTKEFYVSCYFSTSFGFPGKKRHTKKNKWEILWKM